MGKRQNPPQPPTTGEERRREAPNDDDDGGGNSVSRTVLTNNHDVEELERKYGQANTKNHDERDRPLPPEPE